MGWNIGYELMEHMVISLYDKDVLTAELLDQVMTPYKGTDCDSGGSKGLRAKDGLGVEEIICKVVKPREYQNVLDNPVYCDDFEENKEVYMANDNWKWIVNESAQELFYSIWSGLWKMW